MRQLVATILQAIAPEPTLECLTRGRARMRRHITEPPRKRRYQMMLKLS
jgi:hypothetical protein